MWAGAAEAPDLPDAAAAADRSEGEWMRLAGLSPARGRGNTPQPPRARRCGPAIPAPAACAFGHGPRFIPPHDTESLLLGHTSSAFAGIRIRLLDPAHRDRARDLVAGH